MSFVLASGICSIGGENGIVLFKPGLDIFEVCLRSKGLGGPLTLLERAIGELGKLCLPGGDLTGQVVESSDPGRRVVSDEAEGVDGVHPEEEGEKASGPATKL